MTDPDRLHRPPPLRRRGAARVISEVPGRRSAITDADLVRRPDGWYWLAPDGHQEFGPFDSAAQASADRDGGIDEAPTVGESIEEAEAEIGIATWIDAETGEPAEGQSPPHLEQP